jgi:hypothetical protein
MASTVRHLGIGNALALSEDRLNHLKQAIKIYKEHRRYFVYGRFYGISPNIHCHVLEGEGVLALLFNDQREPRRVDVVLDLNQMGVENPGDVCISNVYGSPQSHSDKAGHVSIRGDLEAYDVVIVRIDRGQSQVQTNQKEYKL